MQQMASVGRGGEPGRTRILLRGICLLCELNDLLPMRGGDDTLNAGNPTVHVSTKEREIRLSVISEKAAKPWLSEQRETCPTPHPLREADDFGSGSTLLAGGTLNAKTIN